MKTIQTCVVKDYLAVDKIKLHPENPRTINPDRMKALKDSIIKKGFYEPILVWKKNSYVLSGNHRLKAVRELLAEGWKLGDGKNTGKLPVVWIDEDDDTAQKILFETNNRYAEWIDEKVREALGAVSDGDFIGYGFTDKEISLYINAALDGVADISVEDDDEEESIKPIEDDDLRQMINHANLGVVFNRGLAAQINRRAELFKQLGYENYDALARRFVIEALEEESDESVTDRHQAD